jgi:hypothetical protein
VFVKFALQFPWKQMLAEVSLKPGFKEENYSMLIFQKAQNLIYLMDFKIYWIFEATVPNCHMVHVSHL